MEKGIFRYENLNIPFCASDASMEVKMEIGLSVEKREKVSFS